jgi:hypothetical protein
MGKSAWIRKALLSAAGSDKSACGISKRVTTKNWIHLGYERKCQRRRERDAILAVDNGSGLFPVKGGLKMQVDGAGTPGAWDFCVSIYQPAVVQWKLNYAATRTKY